MDRDTLLALAARVEAAAEADRALDAEIAEVMGWQRPRGRHRSWRSPSGYSYGFDGWPRYTASLDAAASLVPADRAVIIGWGQTSDTRCWARVGLLTFGADQCCATPALALTAAALRARAEEARDE